MALSTKNKKAMEKLKKSLKEKNERKSVFLTDQEILEICSRKFVKISN